MHHHEGWQLREWEPGHWHCAACGNEVVTYFDVYGRVWFAPSPDYFRVMGNPHTGYFSLTDLTTTYGPLKRTGG